MVLYLIRHGHAEDRAFWDRPDMERPLIKKGLIRAERAFARFFSIYEKPEIIISSEAVRSLQTADVLSRVCGADIAVRSALNPGAGDADFESVLAEFGGRSSIAVVGHEPDMSFFISSYLSDGSLSAEFKKGSICHIENRCLINLVQQKVLR